ncbi:uncharacterized protein LOC132563366 [Ylistrum balloti]|uniref:uncharacterized protein LOC132563366 n=1 Tax=Ylistrum balloti TaxID=509963 RepID=UPI002905D3FE|nr:uncharacterized protein LOC132563366 [Ylistrum balloti]
MDDENNPDENPDHMFDDPFMGTNDEMNREYGPQLHLDPMFEEDPAMGTNDEVSGFLNNLVDQSITDLIEDDTTLGEFQDEESPLPDLTVKKKKSNKDFSTSKSLPSLDLKQMDGISKVSTPTQKTSSLPSVRRKPSPVRVDNWDLRKHTLIRQYQKAMIDSYVNHVPVIREEPETSSRTLTSADLASPSPSQTPEATKNEEACTQDNNVDIDFDMDDEIGDFISDSLSTITSEFNVEAEKKIDLVGTPVASDKATQPTLKSLVGDVNSDHEGHSLKETSDVNKAEREIEKELRKDEDDSVKVASTFISGQEEDVTGLKEALEIEEATVDIGCEKKTSSGSIFGLVFKRRKSKVSLKLKFPCFGLICCGTLKDVNEDSNSQSNLNTAQAKKPGLVKRLFPFLKKKGARVAPVIDQN